MGCFEPTKDNNDAAILWNILSISDCFKVLSDLCQNILKYWKKSSSRHLDDILLKCTKSESVFYKWNLIA